MPVVIEALSIIIRVETLNQRYPGGVDGYERDCPNQTFCKDEYLTRIGFMHGIDVVNWLNQLFNAGLNLYKGDDWDEVASVNEFKGLTRPCAVSVQPIHLFI